MKWVTCPSNSSCSKCLNVAFETGEDLVCLKQKWSENQCAFEGNFLSGGARVFVSSQQCLIDGNMEMIQVTAMQGIPG